MLGPLLAAVECEVAVISFVTWMVRRFLELALAWVEQDFRNSFRTVVRLCSTLAWVAGLLGCAWESAERPVVGCTAVRCVRSSAGIRSRSLDVGVN